MFFERTSSGSEHVVGSGGIGRASHIPVQRPTRRTSVGEMCVKGCALELVVGDMEETLENPNGSPHDSNCLFSTKPESSQFYVP